MRNLVVKIIFAIYYRLVNRFQLVVRFKRKWFHFLGPNWIPLLQNRIFYQFMPICHQKLRVTGEGVVLFGDQCVFGYRLGGNFERGVIEIQPRYEHSKIEIGSNVATNNNLILCAANLIKIGDNTLIGEGVTMMDHEAHGLAPHKRRELGEIGKVVVGKNVWIGNKVTILKNSEIGDNTVVAAGAVVSGEFPANVVIGGIPAKIIKEL